MSKMLSLYSELDKNIYAEQSTGYVSQTHSGIVLNKDVYGLKQVSRACWYAASNFDPNLFVKACPLVRMWTTMIVKAH